MARQEADGVVLVHHSANRDHDRPANSLSAMKHCLEASARIVEVDITPLREGGFALLHGPELSDETDGKGKAYRKHASKVQKLRYRLNKKVTKENVALLPDAVSLISEHLHLDELQLDLKEYAPLDDTVLEELLQSVDAQRHRVRITSVADWALRRLRQLDSDILLGFDPLLYIEPRKPPKDYLPFRLGAFGYWDDHPLAAEKWGTNLQYLRLRAETLWDQAPSHAAWYLRASLLCQVLDDGFDWIGFLQDRGALIDVWTLDPHGSGIDVARRLAHAGVDRITTNDAPGLASALDGLATL
jgi:glycerophosphoryl diester phosphodiesterase